MDTQNEVVRLQFSRRAFVRLAVISSFSSLLAACGQSSGSGSAGTPPASATPGGAGAVGTAKITQATPSPTIMISGTPIDESHIGSGPVKITWWHIQTSGQGRENWARQAAEFTRSHPNVTIQITVIENQAFKNKLATAMQSGSPPDIFQSWGGGRLGEFVQGGLVKDITDELQKDGWISSFLPGPLDLYKINGRYYGVPWQAGIVGFWYNKRLFQKAGITSPPTTWNEFLDTVKKLKAAGITPIAIGEKDNWTGAFYWEYLALRIGGKDAFLRAYNRQGSFADKPFVDAGYALKQLVDLAPFQTGFLGATQSDEQSLMANEQAAMELMGQWAEQADASVAPNPDEFKQNIGWFPFPVVEGGAGQPTDALGGADGFSLGRNAPPEAIELVRFLTRPELQKEMGASGLASLPTVKEASSSVTDPVLRQVQDALAKVTYYQLYYDIFLPPATGDTVDEVTQRIFAGTATPEDVAKAIEQAAAADLGRK